MDREIVRVLKKKKHRSLELNVFQLETAQTLQGFQNCQEIVLNRSNLPGSSKPNVFREDLSYYFGSFTPEFLSNSALIWGQTSYLIFHFLQRHTVVLGCDFLVGGAAVSSFSWGKLLHVAENKLLQDLQGCPLHAWKEYHRWSHRFSSWNWSVTWQLVGMCDF